MRALISCLLNIYIPQLAIYITALLSHMSPTPNSIGAPRDATQRNAGEIFCADRPQGFLNALRRGCVSVGHILVVNIQFNKQCTKITCPLLFARG